MSIYPLKKLDVETQIKIFKDARKRISNEENWCQSSLAKRFIDGAWRDTSESDENAIKWCAIGTLKKSVYNFYYIKFWIDIFSSFDKFCKDEFEASIFGLNDKPATDMTKIHQNVIDLYERMSR